jgi:hypothetical protein
MTCPLHKIGYQLTKNISDALYSPEWLSFIDAHPKNFQEESALLLAAVQDIQSRLLNISPGEVTLSPALERILQAASKELDIALIDMKNVKEVHQIASSVIAIMAKFLSQAR